MKIERDANITRYVVIFCIGYVCLTGILALVVWLTSFDVGSSTSFVVLLTSGLFTANRFVVIEERAPYDEEKNKLAVLCLISLTILSAAAVILAGLADPSLNIFSMFSQGGLGILTVVLGIILAVHYGILRLVFGWFSQKMYSKLENKM